MRLTRQSEIAVALLVRCASAPYTTVRTDEIARSIGTTKDHAAQIVGQLVQAGFMKSTRGRYGGIQLAHNPENIRLGDVLQYVQPDLVFHMPTAKNLSIEEDCKTLRAILAEAEANFLAVMDRYCVADLADNKKVFNGWHSFKRLGIELQFAEPSQKYQCYHAEHAS